MTYFDTGPTENRPGYEAPAEDRHDWRAFTDARLRWLYGPAHKTERAAMTEADLEAWKRLGHPQNPQAIHSPNSANKGIV